MTATPAEVTRPQLYRIYYIDRMIRARSYPNTGNLARELGVSRRTILRDVEYLKDSFSAPLEYNARERGYYYTEPEYSLGLLKLTEGELLSLYLSHQLLAKCRGAPYARPVITAFNKICEHLQEEINIDFGRLAETISFDLEPLRGEEEKVASNFSDIARAIKNKRQIKIKHYSIAADSSRDRTVDPYMLRYYQGAWYMFGYCHLRGEMRIFALDRMQELQPTRKAFEIPPGFSPDKYFEDTFQFYKGEEIGSVEIWFSSRQARWIKERKWHPTQRITEHPDGSLTLAFQTSGFSQVKRWVLSFGREARMLAPPKLVEEIAAELGEAAEQYD